MHNRFIFSTFHKFYYYALFLYVIVFTFFIYGYFQLPQMQKKFQEVVLALSIDGTDKMADETIALITKDTKSLVLSHYQNQDLREKNERELSRLKRGNISSVFIIFIKKGQLSYLLDTSSVEKGEFGELFQAEDFTLFQKIMEDKNGEVFIQNGLNNLGFTLIKPIIEKDKVVAFLMLDYQQKSLDILIIKVVEYMIIFKNILAFIGLLLLLLGIYLVYMMFVKESRYSIAKTQALKRNYLIDNYEKINFSDYYISLINIDFFKRINDIYGEEIGDKLIVELMKNISLHLRKQDVFIQYSGEEFLLFIYKENMSVHNFKLMMEEIRMMVEELELYVNKEPVYLTVSIGTLLESQNSKSLQDAIYKADVALYKAKHNGRNRVYSYELSSDKRLYRQKLKDMIEDDKLVCYYQPIVSLVENKIIHYEALLRIEDGGKIIYPDKILPDFEDSYFYSRISMKVIEFNIKKLRENPKFKVSINLSSDDLLNDSIIGILIKNKDISDRLLVEILENKFIDYSKMEVIIRKLRFFGYVICIDDFGTGYSNFDHLLNLSIDYLKLDGSMIKNIHKDNRAHGIIRTLTEFCNENGIKVIAEYVENLEIVDLLKEFGVEYGQGYYFSKPLPYDTFYP
ncbi:MAG: bifunctional diguanylate cyclase/phosphodiesterase [Sulfurovaceae bacterium]|nr:bifunctional diguanylate cyclase/phosphodiesterase [Sulfurovaceae bacterium]